MEKKPNKKNEYRLNIYLGKELPEVPAAIKKPAADYSKRRMGEKFHPKGKRRTFPGYKAVLIDVKQKQIEEVRRIAVEVANKTWIEIYEEAFDLLIKKYENYDQPKAVALGPKKPSRLTPASEFHTTDRTGEPYSKTRKNNYDE